MRLSYSLVLLPLMLLGVSSRAPNVIDVRAVPSRFTPDRVVVHVGQTATLRFAQTGGVHGLYSADLGIDHVVIAEGQTVIVTMTPRKPGTYVLHCRIYCGPDHPSMTLTVVVEP